MRDITEVIRRKETELQQLQRDIDALRVAARLLADEEAGNGYTARPTAENTYAAATRSAPSQAGYGASWDAKRFP